MPENTKGTKAFVEEYQGILVHDHDLTFYNYGCAHQECLDHLLRYLKDSMENEPGLTWNKKADKIIANQGTNQGDGSPGSPQPAHNGTCNARICSQSAR